MGAWWIVGAVLVAAGPGDEVPPLVAGLSAPRRADRERAARRLEALGDAARPALVEAAGSNDLELRARAAAVLDAIEGQALGRPTPVALDFRDVPLNDVLDAVSVRTGLGLALQPWPDPRRGERRITVEAPAPVPFWEAVDRLARAGGVRPELSPNPGFNRAFIGLPPPQAGPGRRPARPITGNEVMLVPDAPGAAPPSVISGRFLVALTALNHHRDRVLPGPNGRPPGSVADRFEARLHVAPEPDLTIGQIGDVEALEAEDDLGQTLVPAGPVVEATHGWDAPNNAYAPRNGAAAIALRYPDRAGSRIRRLKGVLPITVVGTSPDPVVASLVEGLGRPARKGDVAVTVHEVRPVPEAANVRVVELSLVRPEAQGQAIGYGGFNRTMIAPPAATQGWFEFVDAGGKLVARVPAPPILADDGQRRVVRIAEPQGRAVSVRYVAPAWATLAVPFEFRDLPMP